MAGESPLPEPQQTEQPLFSHGAKRPYQEMWLEVRVNEKAMSRPAHLIKLQDGRLLANVVDFLRWRIRRPDTPPFSLRGKEYLPLDALEGLDYEIDLRTQVLLIRGRPDIFLLTRLNAGNTTYAPPDPPSTGAFLNYDLQFQRFGESRLDGLLELGLFNRLGFGTSTFLGHGLGEDDGMIRLDTAWTRDDSMAMRSLRIGDSIGRSGSWGRSVRFGGIQWGSSFGIRPDFVPFPLPGFAGEAALPSTVDLYVDNALRLSRPVPPGPFSITEVPVITGEGEIRLVVRDLLGRENQIIQPYYASADLLREGLHDYTYEVGFLRLGYGVEDADYGSFFLAATHRAGLSQRLTGELRAEIMDDRQILGGGIAYHWPGLGMVDGSLALSNSEEGGGGQLSLGLERQGRSLGFSLRTQLASSDFTQLGATQLNPPATRLSVARANLATGFGGSAFISYLDRESPRQGEVELVSVGYSVNLFDDYYLSAFAAHSLGDESVRSFGISLTRALGPRTSANASWNLQGSDSTPSFQVQHSLPQGSGIGYRLASTGGPQRRQEAALLMQSEAGTYGVEATRTSGGNGQRLSASGGATLLGGNLYLSRRLDDSFAVVEVGDYSGVTVYADNHPVAQTDADGTALVPSLRAYQRNRIGIRQGDLPLDARIDVLDMTVTPRRRSGSLVEFPVRSARGALLKIVLDDGSPMPVGSVVRVPGQEEAFPVARRGEAYVTGLKKQNYLRAFWKGRDCELEVELPAEAGPLPVLGPLVCHGVRP